MDEKTYQQWWPLHLRLAKGETLSAEEQAEYEAGSKGLESNEMLTMLSEVVEAREELAALEAERDRLLEERARLEQEIALLKAALRFAQR